MWLCNYFVLAEYRWHGVGRALWDSLMDAIVALPEAVGRTAGAPRADDHTHQYDALVLREVWLPPHMRAARR